MLESEASHVLIEQFIESLLSERGYSLNTCRAYKNDLEAFADFVASDGKSGQNGRTGRLEEMDGLAIRRYLAHLHRRQKTSSIARRLSAISSFFRFIERNEVV